MWGRSSVAGGKPAVRPFRRHLPSHTLGLEALEPRVLLTVIDITSTSVAAFAYPQQSWNASGIVDGFIPQGTFLLDNFLQDEEARADGYSSGTDPGHVLPDSHHYKITAAADSLASVQNGGFTTAQSYSVVDYAVSIIRVKDLPGAFPEGSISVPIVARFQCLTTILGDPAHGNKEHAIARAYVEAISSSGGEPFEMESKIDWDLWRGAADSNGGVTDIFTTSGYFNLTYEPDTGASGHLAVTLNASTSCSAVLGEGEYGIITPGAQAYPYNLRFNQAEFDAAYGDHTFSLAEYFQFVVGVNQGDPPPDDGDNPNLIFVGSVPDLVASSDTGESDADNLTGDLTPTFAGLANAGQKPLKKGVAVLYVDGQQAAISNVVNGAYRLTVSDELVDGVHAVRVAVGSDLQHLGNTSQPLQIVIDSELPRGDQLTTTLHSGIKLMTFTDTDGSIASLKLSAGQAQLHFTGEDVELVNGKKGLTLTSPAAQLTSIDLTGDTTTAKLIITTKRGTQPQSDAMIQIASLTSQNAVHTITASGVSVTGNVQLAGLVKVLALHGFTGATQHTMNLGGSSNAAATTVVLREVHDLTLNSGSPLKSLTVDNWYDALPDEDVITAPSLKKLNKKGVFEATLNLG
jgi:hypothetical protein